MTFTVVGWLDVFSRKRYRDIFIDSMKFCIQNKGLRVHAYVIMSNHIHVIFSAREGYQISDIVRDIKRHTATTIIKDLIKGQGESRSEWMLRLFKYFAKFNANNEKFQLWKKGNKPIELISPKWLNQKLAYIHLNPVRAGIVSKAEHFVYSSANYYLNDQGILAVDKLNFDLSIGYIDS